MNPMIQLIAAAAVFLATHYVTSTPLRARLVALLGQNGYLVLYSAAAFATLGWMVWAYYRAPFMTLWFGPGLRFVPLIVMPFSLILIVSGLLARNPSLVGQEQLLRSGTPARGILRVTRHPLMWGIALWAAAHVIARG
ncbi:MAG: NnrU family protein, partial [Betaproteobacteria bacterium]|nr:NnrU family protein [Betaproteobacteria bacterium]